MKRFIFSFILLSTLATLAYTQAMFFSQTVIPASGCSQATSFVARTSGLDATHTTNYTNLICGMVTDGTWSSLDVLYVFATNSTGNAALNLVSSSFNATTHATLTFSADHGWTGDGSAGYIDTGFNPSTAGGHFVQNSSSMGAYVLSGATGTFAEMGYLIGGNDTRMIPSFGGTLFIWAVNSNAQVASSNSVVASSWIETRTGASAQALYKNGASLFTDTTASQTVPNSDIFVFAENTGSPTSFSPHALSAAFIGGGLTSGNAGLVASRLNTYMTAYGINVY